MDELSDPTDLLVSSSHTIPSIFCGGVIWLYETIVLLRRSWPLYEHNGEISNAPTGDGSISEY